MWRQLHPAVQSERSLRLPSPSCPQGGTCRHSRADGSRAIRGSLCGRPQSETRWKAAPHLLSAGDAVVRALRESLSLLTRNEPSAEPCEDLSPKWQSSSALAFTSSLASSSANFASRLALRKSWYAPKLQIRGRPGLFCRPHRSTHGSLWHSSSSDEGQILPSLPTPAKRVPSITSPARLVALNQWGRERLGSSWILQLHGPSSEQEICLESIRRC